MKFGTMMHLTPFPGPFQPMKFDVRSCLGLVGQFTLLVQKSLAKKNMETPHADNLDIGIQMAQDY